MKTLEDLIKEYLILELYRRHEISSGIAAEWLGMERFEFVRYASRLGIPYIDMDARELEAEIGQAYEPAKRVWGVVTQVYKLALQKS